MPMMQGDRRVGNPDALIKIGVRITPENLTLLQELAMTVNSTPSAVLRTIIKDFEIRNRKFFDLIQVILQFLHHLLLLIFNVEVVI